jgi:hypothetical protein
MTVTHAYIGIKDGRCRGATGDHPDHVQTTARVVAGWIRKGWTVRRVTVAEANQRVREIFNTEKKKRHRPVALPSQSAVKEKP